MTALAQTQRELLRRQEDLSITNQCLQETLIDEREPEGFNLVDTLNMSVYREHLTLVRNWQEEEVSKAGVKVEECRSFAVEKRRDKLVLEKLREKKYALYRDEVNKSEQKEFDEQGTQRAAFNNRSLFG